MNRTKTILVAFLALISASKLAAAYEIQTHKLITNNSPETIGSVLIDPHRKSIDPIDPQQDTDGIWHIDTM